MPQAVRAALGPRADGQAVQVCSVGGGPGTDVAGLVCAAAAFFGGQRVHCHLLDYEATWRRYVKTLGTLFAPHEVDFARCDVTLPLAEDINQPTAALVPVADLYVFAYVCNETHLKTDRGGHAFYRDLAAAAKPGAVFIFMDVLTHSAATLQAVHAAMAAAANVRAWTPPPSFAHGTLSSGCELLVLQKQE